MSPPATRDGVYKPFILSDITSSDHHSPSLSTLHILSFIISKVLSHNFPTFTSTSSMPSIRYFNQTAPFWDFVASLEDQFADGPLFNEPNERNKSNESNESNESSETEKGDPTKGNNTKAADENPCAGRGYARGQCGGRGRFCHRGRGGFRHGYGSPFAGHPFAYVFRPNAGTDTNNQDHTPPADVFDTEDGYVIHISLPGARKEDVGINWDADKSELSVAGVIYRPGDEEFLKTLALDERTVGAFEKKVRLGNSRHPAKVEDEAITAKLEDGEYLGFWLF
jgi:HSP20 family protein